jgi:hypothetical protein
LRKFDPHQLCSCFRTRDDTGCSVVGTAFNATGFQGAFKDTGVGIGPVLFWICVISVSVAGTGEAAFRVLACCCVTTEILVMRTFVEVGTGIHAVAIVTEVTSTFKAARSLATFGEGMAVVQAESTFLDVDACSTVLFETVHAVAVVGAVCVCAFSIFTTDIRIIFTFVDVCTNTVTIVFVSDETRTIVTAICVVAV